MALAHQRPQGTQERRVGQLTLALLHRVPTQDKRFHVCHPAFELADHARLADARLAAEQNQNRPASGRLPRCQLEFRELAHSTDEVSAGQPGSHVQSIA